MLYNTALVLMATLNSNGSTFVGEMLNLTCSIILREEVNGSLMLQWIGPDGSPVVSMGPSTVGITTSISLYFDTLFISHSGEYTCQSELVTQEDVYAISVLQDVIVRGTYDRSFPHRHYDNSVLHSVPAPTVNITGFDVYPIYTGTSLLLTCTIELPAEVMGNPVTLDSIWRRGGDSLSSDSRVTISDINKISPHVYRTTLSIIPLNNTVDSGRYSCQSVITSTAYVLYTDASQQVLVRVEGNYFYYEAMFQVTYIIFFRFASSCHHN